MNSLIYPFHIFSKTQVPFVRSDLFALTEIFSPFSFKFFPILWRTMDSSRPYLSVYVLQVKLNSG